jgi:hypothetical protein
LHEKKNLGSTKKKHTCNFCKPMGCCCSCIVPKPGPAAVAHVLEVSAQSRNFQVQQQIFKLLYRAVTCPGVTVHAGFSGNYIEAEASNTSVRFTFLRGEVQQAAETALRASGFGISAAPHSTWETIVTFPLGSAANAGAAAGGTGTSTA